MHRTNPSLRICTIFYQSENITVDCVLQLQENVTVRVARIFNTFGPRMHMNDGRVVSNFVLQALQNLPMTVCINTLAFTANITTCSERNSVNLSWKRSVCHLLSLASR